MIFFQCNFTVPQSGFRYLDSMVSTFSKSSLFLTFLIGSFFSSAAAAQNQIEQIARLNAAGQSQAAYELSMQLLPEYEGEPAFDLHYGVAAVDYGKISEGVFALQRVLMNEPNNDYARLELARAYFALEEDDRAKAEFDRVLSANPPERVVESIQPYLRAIESRRYKRESIWVANIGLKGGYDSNVNAAPDDGEFGSVDTGLLSVAESEGSSFAQLKADATFSKPIVYGTNGFIGVHASKTDNLDPDLVDVEGDLDLLNYGLKLGLLVDRGRNNWRFSVQADALELDDDDYRQSYGLNASFSHQLNAQTTAMAFALLKDLDYDGIDFERRDSNLAILGGSLRHRFDAKFNPVLSTSITFGREDAKNKDAPGALANTQRDILGANASLVLRLSEKVRVDSNLGVQRSEYEEEAFAGPGGFAIREDTRISLNLGVSWDLSDQLEMRLDGSMSNTDSSVVFLEHDRNQIGLSASYAFR